VHGSARLCVRMRCTEASVGALQRELVRNSVFAWDDMHACAHMCNETSCCWQSLQRSILGDEALELRVGTAARVA